jgi:hypothetical protein
MTENDSKGTREYLQREGDFIVKKNKIVSLYCS